MAGAAPSPPPSTRRRLWLTALTGISQGIGFLSVGLLGLLIAARFGASATTDGFFIAQSIYAIVLLIGQSLRTTSVAELARDPDRSIAETLGAVALIALAAAVAFAVIAFALVPLLTSELPAAGTRTAQESLLVLWPAAALQLAAGALAAILATRDRVGFAAMAYSIGAVVGLAAFLPLEAATGATSLPLVLLVTSVCSAGLLLIDVLRSGGLRLRRPQRRRTLSRTGALLLGAVGIIVGQVIVASSVALAGQVGEQAATTYAYGMMAISVVTATAVTPAMVVLAPVMATDWDRTTKGLVDFAVKVFRFGALLVVPVVAGVVLIGAPVLNELMDESSRETVPDIVMVILALSPTVLGTLAVMIPELGLITQGRFSTVARVALFVVALHLAIVIPVVLLGGGLLAITLITMASSLVSAGAVTAFATGGDRGRALRGFLTALAELVVPAVLAYLAAAAVIGETDELAPGIAAWIAGSIVAVGWLLVTRRGELRELLAMVRPGAA